MHTHEVITVGVAGGIGSGKSTFAAKLAAAGHGFLSNSDAMVRELFTRDGVKQQLVKLFGSQALDAQGQVDRVFLASHVFVASAKRKQLEELLYPLLAEDRVRQRAACLATGKRLFILDAPLLFEAGLDAECDAVIFVEVPRGVRLSRVQASRSWSEAELARREAAQWPVERKKAASDLVVRNDGAVEDLDAEVARAAAWLASEFPINDRT
jgi:dephospho-CoA kinase